MPRTRVATRARSQARGGLIPPHRPLALDAPNLVVHGPVAVGAGAEPQAGRDARRAHREHDLMAAPDGGEDRVPLALDIGPVRVKAGLEPRFPEDPLAGGDLTGDGRRPRYRWG